MLQPRKTLPSARTRTAGVFCDTELLQAICEGGAAADVKKARRALRKIPLAPLWNVENYIRAAPLNAASGRPACRRARAAAPPRNAPRRARPAHTSRGRKSGA